jgi:hypothetical protein
MNATTHKIAVLMVAFVALVWTIASLATLVYWSGLVLWVAGAIAVGGFAWTLRVYLRPTQHPEMSRIPVNRPSA